MKKDKLAWCAAQCVIAALYCMLPLLPALAAILFMRWKFVRHYAHTLRRMRLHVTALREGPVQHFFRDVMGRSRSVPAEIRGSCVQCGNCCMERRCAFLEQVSADKYECGIYHSVWRRFSNCSSFPLNQHDIDRYACPSYYTVPGRTDEPLIAPMPTTHWAPVRFVKRRA